MRALKQKVLNCGRAAPKQNVKEGKTSRSWSCYLEVVNGKLEDTPSLLIETCRLHMMKSSHVQPLFLAILCIFDRDLAVSHCGWTDASWPLEFGGKLETGATMADYFTKRHTPHCCTSMIRDTGGGTQQIP